MNRSGPLSFLRLERDGPGSLEATREMVSSELEDAGADAAEAFILRRRAEVAGGLGESVVGRSDLVAGVAVAIGPAAAAILPSVRRAGRARCAAAGQGCRSTGSR